ncbi:MAG: hypothetical protein IJ013_04795 [Bacteroidaceae bacterium]|nr:hypothetical protein [Bacteroidaceae bacterium]
MFHTFIEHHPTHSVSEEYTDIASRTKKTLSRAKPIKEKKRKKKKINERKYPPPTPSSDSEEGNCEAGGGRTLRLEYTQSIQFATRMSLVLAFFAFETRRDGSPILSTLLANQLEEIPKFELFPYNPFFPWPTNSTRTYR